MVLLPLSPTIRSLLLPLLSLEMWQTGTNRVSGMVLLLELTRRTLLLSVLAVRSAKVVSFAPFLKRPLWNLASPLSATSVTTLLLGLDAFCSLVPLMTLLSLAKSAPLWREVLSNPRLFLNQVQWSLLMLVSLLARDGEATLLDLSPSWSHLRWTASNILLRSSIFWPRNTSRNSCLMELLTCTLKSWNVRELRRRKAKQVVLVRLRRATTNLDCLPLKSVSITWETLNLL